MKKIKKIAKKLFFLPIPVTVLIAIPSFVMVGFALAFQDKTSPLTYVSYLLSSYSLVISITATIRIVKSYKQAVAKSQLYTKYRHDIFARAKISLYCSLIINLGYVIMKLGYGLYINSFWLVAIGLYYGLLAVMRVSLIGTVNKNQLGQNRLSELKKERICGICLVLINSVLSVIVGYMVNLNYGFEYPGMMIYVMAAYSFYAVITAIVNLVQYRKYNSPVLMSLKVINLTTAMMSMLSLETAMFSQFGDKNENDFQHMMTSVTGSVVCVIVLVMAIWMIVRSTREIRQLKNE